MSGPEEEREAKRPEPRPRARGPVDSNGPVGRHQGPSAPTPPNVAAPDGRAPAPSGPAPAPDGPAPAPDGPESGLFGGQPGPSSLLPEPSVAPPPEPHSTNELKLPEVPPASPAPGATKPVANSEMTLTSPTAGARPGRDWAVVLAVALVAEVALLWLVSCVGVWRRRMALRRD